jgi:hypothetical protein
MTPGSIDGSLSATTVVQAPSMLPSSHRKITHAQVNPACHTPRRPITQNCETPGIMGATPNQVLSIAALLAFHELWLGHPGTYEVRPTENDVLAALPQIFVKAFAADQRDNGFGPGVGEQRVEGELTSTDGHPTPITVRYILNKIIHGRPSKFEVLEPPSGLPSPTSAPAQHLERLGLSPATRERTCSTS